MLIAYINRFFKIDGQIVDICMAIFVTIKRDRYKAIITSDAGLLWRLLSFFLDERHVPRAILLDFDCKGVDNMLSKYRGSLFKPDNIVCGTAGTNNNWAKGYYSEGADLLDRTLEIVRTEVEACDSVQG